MSAWLSVHAIVCCPLCDTERATPCALLKHLASLHPETGVRTRSLIMDAVRRELGWPTGLDMKLGLRDGPGIRT